MHTPVRTEAEVQIFHLLPQELSSTYLAKVVIDWKLGHKMGAWKDV